MIHFSGVKVMRTGSLYIRMTRERRIGKQKVESQPILAKYANSGT